MVNKRRWAQEPPAYADRDCWILAELVDQWERQFLDLHGEFPPITGPESIVDRYLETLNT